MAEIIRGPAPGHELLLIYVYDIGDGTADKTSEFADDTKTASTVMTPDVRQDLKAILTVSSAGRLNIK